MALINKLSAIGDAIREKTGKEDLLTLEQMPQEIRSIETGGGSDTGLDLFSYIQTPPAFSQDLQEVTENITLHMERATSISNMLSGVTLNCPKLTIYISNKCTSFFRAIRLGAVGEIKEIEIIGNTSNVTNYSAAFAGRSGVERITCEFDFSSVTVLASATEMISGCTALQEFRIKANTLSISFSASFCKNLSDASIKSIINGLADLTGGTTQTLTLHADVKAKLTDEQIAAITNKNWTLA